MPNPLPADNARRATSAAAWVVAVLLMVPEFVLARREMGSSTTAVTVASDGATVIAGMLVGLLVASSVLRGRPRSRRLAAILAVVSLVVGFGVLALANIVPPPLITSPPPPGVLTVNGVLNALYLVGIIGSGTAALRFTAHIIAASATRTRRESRPGRPHAGQGRLHDADNPRRPASQTGSDIRTKKST